MGDFERVFGAGADMPSNYGAFEEMKAKEAVWRDFAERALLRNALAHSSYTIYLPDYEAVRRFDRQASDRTDGTFDFAFLRRREGAGYRVDVSPEARATFFARPGRVLVVGEREDALVCAKDGTIPIFQQIWPSHNGFSPFYRDRRRLTSSETSRLVFERWRSLEQGGSSLPGADPTILEHLDKGEDVILFGYGGWAVLELEVMFSLWSKHHGETIPRTEEAFNTFGWRS